MKIGLITTLNTNIGDDFIREGILRVLRKFFTDRSLTFIPINKHEPYTVYCSNHPLQSVLKAWNFPRGKTRLMQLADRMGALTGSPSVFDSCEMIVQCGAPVYCDGCSWVTEWRQILWDDVVNRLHKQIPVLNLAAGSCYPLERLPETVENADDAQFFRTLNGYCTLTTVRDTLAQKLHASLGIDVPMIPCSAFLAPDHPAQDRNDGKTILINYMPGGGHYDFDQNIDKNAWEATVRTLISRFQKRYKLVLLCHNKREYDAAEALDASLPRLFPKTPQEYFEAVATATGAINNRMHASVAMGGLGIPSVTVGTDSRLLMVKQFGMPCHYVKEPTADQIEQELEDLIARRQEERERLLTMRGTLENMYLTTMQARLK